MDSTQRVLVVEDDPLIARYLELELGHIGFAVQTVEDAETALDRMGDPDSWSAVILDLMLPGRDGLELCSAIRAVSQVPIIILTARGQTPDKVRGLDAGADDYLTKPFAIEELVARLKAVFRRRGQGGPGEVLRAADLTLNPATREVHRGGALIHLTKKEFDLLEFLLRNERLVVRREHILSRVWGLEYEGSSNLVDVYIRYLRAKVDDPFPSKLIHTVRGVGYVLREEAPVP